MPTDCENQARNILADLDRDPSYQIVRFMKALSLLFVDDPHMKILRFAEVVHQYMPKTIANYNGFE